MMRAAYPNHRRVPLAYHAVAAAFVAFCLWLSATRPEVYREAMQEDRLIEWLSVVAYAAAGVVMLVAAARTRRPFDGLVGLFLLFVAGEEMSWGQRLLGLTPPAWFLEHNTQQEMNVHNFAQVFGGPKGPFTLILTGYAVLMPLVALIPPGRRLLDRVGATPPAAGVIPWFLVAIALFIWYPVSFTGEWNELLAGSAFLVAAGASAMTLGALLPAGLLLALTLTRSSARGSDHPVLRACAAAELQELIGVPRADVTGSAPAHKRVWTLAREGRLGVDSLRASLARASCAGAGHDVRRDFAVDPWGTAYWMRIAREGETTVVTVYSFGPNRRRDMDPAASRAGDDLFIRRTLSPDQP